MGSREWLRNGRLGAASLLLVWAAGATVAASWSLQDARRLRVENALLQREIAHRDRTDFLAELDECAQDLVATHSLLADRLDWMARNHLVDLYAFGERITADDETFDFQRSRERQVWAREALRINEDLTRRGRAPLPVY